MSGLQAGYDYPGIVRAGIHLIIDPPVEFQIRVDADGEKKAEERRLLVEELLVHRDETDKKEQMARHWPRDGEALKTIHLQWLDDSHEPVWRDTAIHIDLEKHRFKQIEGWLIGNRHHGSGAIGVVLLSVPVLAVISPYLFARAQIYRAKERKQGMSRHGINLLKQLKGQLDPETEALLVQTLKNEWAHHLKMNRKVRFDEASDLLQQCDLTLSILPHEHAEAPTLIGDFVWLDDDGDMIAHAQFVGENLHFMTVLRTEFEEDPAKALIASYRSCRIISDEKS
jgi:hypothetical protein